MPLSLSLNLGLSARNSGSGPSFYAPYAAPAGYRWDYVTEQSEIVREGGVPLVELRRAI